MDKQTLALHFGYEKDGYKTMAVPIYQTTAYDFESAERAANLFSLQELGPIYTRLNNPTTEVLENRIAALEDGAAAIVTASGQSAIFYSVANLAGAGDNVIVANKVYGGTTTLLTHTLKRFGIEAKVFDSDNADDLEKKIDEKTKAIFFESLSNPNISVADVEKITEIAKKHGVITICDNTVATPILFNPLNHGVDVVVHSTSKYINGQGTAIGGVVIANKKLNEKLINNDKYPHFNEPDSSYHGLVYADLAGNFDIYTLRIRLSLMRDIGAAPAPFNSWLNIQGVETLALRVKEHSKNALEIAKFLENHPKVKKVNYPGLKSSPYYEKVQKYFKDGMASGLLSFDVGDFEYAKKILNSTKIFSVVVNIGDSKSIITHPASTTHQQLSEEELKESGITPGLIRLSVGIENGEDLIKDLEEAMES